MNKLLLILVISLFSVTMVSANGLVISNLSTSNVNKLVGVNTTITLTLSNTEPFSFYNITFTNNSIVNMGKIPELQSGQSALITVPVITDNNFDGSLLMKGFYTANIGASNTTHNVNVDYISGLSVCDMSVIRGDKVKWNNLVSDEITLKNVDTGIDVTVIPQNGTYTTTFDTPTSFKYTFFRRGFSFTNVCTITSLSDSGLINNPMYDARMNLSVVVRFNPTALAYNIIERNYTLNPFQSSDGVIVFQNIGNQTAKNMMLSGEWVTFNVNNFDLAPQQTKAVVYTFRPQVTKTEETNLTYIKKITVVGNFPTVVENFTIHVPFMNLNMSYNVSNYDSLLGMLQDFCKNNPSVSFCLTTPNVVYVGNGSTSTDFNVTMNTEQVKKIFEYMFQQGDAETVNNNFVKEKMDALDSKMTSTNNQTQEALAKIKALEEERKQSSSTTTFTVILGVVLAISGLLGCLIFITKRYSIKREVETW